MGKGIALVIGLNAVDPKKYNGWKGSLIAAENDARDIGTLVQNIGFETESLLGNNAVYDMVLHNIQRASGRLVNGDIFLLYYSGHGSTLSDLDIVKENDMKDETFCLYDKELLDDILHLGWHGFKQGVRILIVLDCCHSAGMLEFGSNLGNKFKAMPPNIRSDMDVLNRNTYEDEIEKILMAKKKLMLKGVTASVLLISACEETKLAKDGSKNSEFTRALKVVWRDGNFKGNYSRFVELINIEMIDYQFAGLEKDGIPNVAYENQEPFTI